jgi:hypothetical protein
LCRRSSKDKSIASQNKYYSLGLKKIVGIFLRKYYTPKGVVKNPWGLAKTRTEICPQRRQVREPRFPGSKQAHGRELTQLGPRFKNLLYSTARAFILIKKKILLEPSLPIQGPL